MNFLHSPWSKCVLPSPQLPWMNSGLYCEPGNSETYTAALKASWLLWPTTNVSMSWRKRGRDANGEVADALIGISRSTTTANGRMEGLTGGRSVATVLFALSMSATDSAGDA